MTIDRRAILGGAAWTVPVIVLATAAPAAAASTPPPVVCVDPDGLGVRPVTGYPPFKENDGNGFTLVKGDAIVVTNDSHQAITVAVTLWTSAGQEGLRLVTANGDTLLPAPKDGNRATVTITVPADGSRLLQVVSPDKDASAHLIIGCDRGFVLKSSR